MLHYFLCNSGNQNVLSPGREKNKEISSYAKCSMSKHKIPIFFSKITSF